jgi:hypothetical protein
VVEPTIDHREVAVELPYRMGEVPLDHRSHLDIIVLRLQRRLVHEGFR